MHTFNACVTKTAGAFLALTLIICGTGTSTFAADSDAASSTNAATKSTDTAASAMNVTAPEMVDASVAGIQLRDPDSSRSMLGRGIRYITDPANQSMYTQYYNAHGTELLTLTSGTALKYKRAFRSYEFAHQEKKFLLARRTMRSTTRFETGKGIHLGMSEGAVTHILGAASSTEDKDGKKVLHYLLGADTSGYLASFNAKTYTGDYTFTHGELTDAKVTME